MTGPQNESPVAGLSEDLQAIYAAAVAGWLAARPTTPIDGRVTYPDTAVADDTGLDLEVVRDGLSFLDSNHLDVVERDGGGLEVIGIYPPQ